MIYSLNSIFIINVFILSFAVQSVISDNAFKNQDQIKVEAFRLPGTGISPQPVSSFVDQFKPLFPPFGSLVAPRVSDDKELMGHGPLSDYSIKYLQTLSLDEAKELKDKLVKKQWDKRETQEENVRFMYLLDEALYNVGIALDSSVRDVMSKIDLLAHHDIKALAPLDLFTVKKSAKEASKQILRRYLTLSQLTFLKRYVDLALKDILEIDSKPH